MGVTGTQQPRAFTRTIRKRVGARYLLYVPDGYDGDGPQSWPLMLFLHGAGERGNNLRRIKRHGVPRVLDDGRSLPFIVVSPQCPPDDWWSTDILTALLDEVARTHSVDPDRVYVTGLSMGGFGTWSLAIANPHRFAAIAPVCGGGVPSRVCAIKHLPVWTFHGARDDMVPLQRTTDMVDALGACGGNVRLTVYPEAGHDSWTETYANPELYEWLLQQSRADETTAGAVTSRL